MLTVLSAVNMMRLKKKNIPIPSPRNEMDDEMRQAIKDELRKQ